MFKLKLAIALIVVTIYGVGTNVVGRMFEQNAVNISMEKLENPSAHIDNLNYVNTYWQNSLWGFGAVIFFNILLFWSNIKKFFMENLMKGGYLGGQGGFVLALILLTNTGCSYFMKPFQEPVLADISTSQTPFLIELEGDGQQASVQTENYLKSKMVFSRRINIPYRWKQTHRYYLWENGSTGKWIPATRLIVVDRSPVTREWTADTHSGTNKVDQGIWVESKDSIGFSTGITITARIPDDNHAVKFLFNYPPRSQNTIEAHGADPFNIDVARLEEIMDNEIRGRVQAVFAKEAAQLEMDMLRESKDVMLNKIKEDVIPFFDERGIQITNLGQFGGYTYENPKTQEAIDKVFQAQQDQEVAKAEYNAALERKKALKEAGEGEANKILELARGRAEAVKLEADAKSYEVEQVTKNSDSYLKLKQFEVELKKLEVWDGKLPIYMIESGDKMNTFLPLPNSK